MKRLHYENHVLVSGNQEKILRHSKCLPQNAKGLKRKIFLAARVKFTKKF